MAKGDPMPNDPSIFDPPYEPIEELDDEAERLPDDTHDRYLRALAELENLRTRKEEEIVQARDKARAGMLLELLPIIDNLERAIQAALKVEGAAGINQVREGVQLVLDNARHIMKQIGVRGFETVGRTFAAELMMAVAEIPSQLPPTTVVAEIARGYMFEDRLLRPAQVVVAVAKKEE
jgi:molecular chaperone GrpE